MVQRFSFPIPCPACARTMTTPSARSGRAPSRKSTALSSFLTAKRLPTQGTFGCKAFASEDTVQSIQPTDTERVIDLSMCKTFLSSVCALAEAPGEAGGIIAPVATAARAALDAYERGDADSFASFFDVFPTLGSIPQLSFVNPTSPLPAAVQSILDAPGERKKYVSLDLYDEEREPVRYVISPVRTPRSARSTPRAPLLCQPR